MSLASGTVPGSGTWRTPLRAGRMRALVLSLSLPAAVVAQSVPDLIAELASAKTYDDEFVGEDGARSATFAAFERLREAASAAELERLTGHASAVVSCYALRALIDGHPDRSFLEVVRRHLTDQRPLETVRGCIHLHRHAGDVMVELALPRLGEPGRLQLLSDLLAADSRLGVVGRMLRSESIGDDLVPRVHRRARDGDDDALLALARRRLAAATPLLVARLRDERPLRELAVVLQACALHPDPELLEPLAARAGDARATLRTDAGSRVRHWLSALAAQRSAAAGRVLATFVAAVDTDPTRRRQLVAALAEVLAGHPDDPGLAAVRKWIADQR